MSDGLQHFFYFFFRHGITFKEISGESEKVTKEKNAPCEETTLPAILARYQIKDIFNADKFDLFYEALQNLCTFEVSVVQVENTAKCG